MKTPRSLFVCALLAMILVSVMISAGARGILADDGSEHGRIRRVLLISIDGLHAFDLTRYVQTNPGSTLAQLSQTAVTYTNASSAKPSDSFPGLLALVTGGSPLSTGVFYDLSYDRTLSPPGSTCASIGTTVDLTSAIDLNPNALDGGGGIDPNKLPRDPNHGCIPVQPHSFVKVNNIFEAARARGFRTAWSDKHPSYEILNGPSGHGVDDLFNPEIDADGASKSLTKTIAYDDLKVQAVINWIDGKDHTGTQTARVPGIFGMNFQAINQGQKLAGTGYVDSVGTPSPSLQLALDHTDQSLGRIVNELKSQNLFNSTLIVISAKHANSPVDVSKRQIIATNTIADLANSVQPGLVVQSTTDAVDLLWLRDQGKTGAVIATLVANQTSAGIQEILSGETLKQSFKDPLTDNRTPDLIVVSNLGVIYASVTATKIAEHGGFSFDDTSVPILVSLPGFQKTTIKTPVQTTQVAPTILKALGISPSLLQAVKIEKTSSLPGLSFDSEDDDDDDN